MELFKHPCKLWSDYYSPTCRNTKIPLPAVCMDKHVS